MGKKPRKVRQMGSMKNQRKTRVQKLWSLQGLRVMSKISINSSLRNWVLFLRNWVAVKGNMDLDVCYDSIVITPVVLDLSYQETYFISTDGQFTPNSRSPLSIMLIRVNYGYKGSGLQVIDPQSYPEGDG